jgi:hypothetical protein
MNNFARVKALLAGLGWSPVRGTQRRLWHWEGVRLWSVELRGDAVCLTQRTGYRPEFGVSGGFWLYICPQTDFSRELLASLLAKRGECLPTTAQAHAGGAR